MERERRGARAGGLLAQRQLAGDSVSKVPWSP